MDAFPPDMRFRYPWRSYQARVLSELEGYLDDDHLHIVAAPGSGKTVLGLEVARLLNRPALILAPTLTIRNQWVDRLVHLFLPDGGGRPDWISTDIRDPHFLTAATYQCFTVQPKGEQPKQARTRRKTSRPQPRRPPSSRPTSSPCSAAREPRHSSSMSAITCGPNGGGPSWT